MQLARTRQFTIEDFDALPEVRPALEFFGGRVIQKMSPGLPHCMITRDLTIKIQLFAASAGLGEVFPELRCRFGGSSHVFDLAFFVPGRLPNPSSMGEREVITIPPDWAIEILSPGQAVGELSRKLRSGIRRGVRLGWLINKSRRQVHVFRPNGKPQIFNTGDVLDGDVILPGFHLPIADLFQRFEVQ